MNETKRLSDGDAVPREHKFIVEAMGDSLITIDAFEEMLEFELLLAGNSTQVSKKIVSWE